MYSICIVDTSVDGGVGQVMVQELGELHEEKGVTDVGDADVVMQRARDESRTRQEFSRNGRRENSGLLQT